MRCLHCGKRLALFKKFANAEFCSEEHRTSFMREQEELALSRLIDAQQQSQRAIRQLEKRRAAKSKPAQAPTEKLAGIMPLEPHMVEWTWRSLRKEQPEQELQINEFVIPRANMRMHRKVPSAGMVEVPLDGYEIPVEKPRAALFADTVAVPFAASPARLPVFSAPTELITAEEAPAAQVQPVPMPLSLAERLPWMPVIAPRVMQPERRKIGAGAVPFRLGWKPDAFPKAAINIEASGSLIPVEPETVERVGTDAIGPLPLAVAPVRRLIPPDSVHEALVIAVPPADLHLRSALLHAPCTRVEVNSLAAGDVHVIVRLEEPVTGIPEFRRPQLGYSRTSNLVRSGRLPVPMPSAQSGNHIVPVATGPETAPAFLVPPRSKPLPKVTYQPPVYPAQPLRIYPKTVGEPSQWRQSVTAAPCLLEPATSTNVMLRVRPICDWVPTMAPVASLPFDDRPRSVEAHPVEPFSESAEFEFASGGGSGPAFPRPSLQRAGEPGPTGDARQLPLSIDGMTPQRSADAPNAALDPIEVPAATLLGNTRLAPKTPELMPSAENEGGLGEELAIRFGSFWQRVPSMPKWAVVAVLVLVALVRFTPKLPAARLKINTGNSPTITSRWEAVQRNIGKRAAISVTDDFRSGLSDWEGDGNWAQQWSYDVSGFVQTGPLALLTPTIGLRDYKMEFLGQIERRSIGWVVRGRDLKNYQAIKLTVVAPGPVPEVAVQRYVVINGRPGPVKEKLLPMEVRNDTMYQVVTQVQGDDYTLAVQGKIVDSWTETRIKRGGVGFFSGKAEQARIRWVGVWHQYDALGRLCALLAPPSLEGPEREE